MGLNLLKCLIQYQFDVCKKKILISDRQSKAISVNPYLWHVCFAIEAIGPLHVSSVHAVYILNIDKTNFPISFVYQRSDKNGDNSCDPCERKK